MPPGGVFYVFHRPRAVEGVSGGRRSPCPPENSAHTLHTLRMLHMGVVSLKRGNSFLVQKKHSDYENPNACGRM